METMRENGSTPGDRKPIIKAGIMPPEGRKVLNLLDKDIRDKLTQLPEEYTRPGFDNRSTAASLVVNVEPAIENGLLALLGGHLGPKTSRVANLNIVASETHSVAYLEIHSDHPNVPTRTWEVIIGADGDETWKFGAGAEKKTRRFKSKPGASLAMRKILQQADHAEKTIDTYARVIDKWADIAKWDEKDRQIMHASLELAYKYLGDKKRDSGEPYVVHLWETARRLWVWGIRNTSELSAALMHDIPEDSVAFAPLADETLAHWQKRAIDLLIKDFKEAGVRRNVREEAYLTVMMSRPPDGVTEIEHRNGKTQRVQLNYERRDGKYKWQILRDPRIRRIKLSDRSHNLDTLWAKPDADIEKTLQETHDFHVGLIDEIALENPRLGENIRRMYLRGFLDTEALLAARA